MLSLCGEISVPLLDELVTVGRNLGDNGSVHRSRSQGGSKLVNYKTSPAWQECFNNQPTPRTSHHVAQQAE